MSCCRMSIVVGLQDATRSFQIDVLAPVAVEGDVVETAEEFDAQGSVHR